MNECIEQWWNDNDRVKMKCQDLNPFHCYFIHQKSSVDCPGIEPDLHTGKPVTSSLRYK